MKRSAMRLLALLSAVMLLTGVFAVHAEEYAEYSGALSVADARAATGYDTDVYVCVDGVWRDIGDARSFEETIEFDLGWTSFNYDYDVLSVSDLPGSLSDFGYTGHSAADTFFPVTINNGSVASSERKSDWPRDDLIPLGTYGPENMGYDNGEAFGVYYAPNFKVDWNVYNVSASLTELAEDNSFYTISVQGLTDAALATVDYGTAHDTDFGHVVLTGSTATVTVPNDGYAWRYAGNYGSVTINEQATTTTYTFDNVTGPLTLTAETSAVNVTVQTLDMEGNVVGSQVYEVASGGRLPAEALVTPADYAWYNVLGQQISSNNVAAMTFDAATTLTLAPKGYYGTDHAVHFYIYVKDGDSGAWREVHTSDVLYGPVSDSRYAVTAEQLEAAFGAYGFSSDDAWSSIEPRLAQNGKDNDTIWGDTHIVTFGDSWAYPLGHTSGSTRVFAVYYLPQNETALNGGTNRHQLGQNNAFRDVTLTEESTGATVTYTLNETMNLAQWLKTIAAEKPEGWERPVGVYKWIPTNAGQTFDATSTPATLQALTGTEPFVTVTLLDEDGNIIDVIEDVERGTSIAKWLEDNDGLQLADGTTLHEYKWTLLHDLSITTQVFDEDKTLVGKKKPLYTITFVDQNPDGSEDGGDFINGSESYTTIQVLEGDSIPESFVARMQANLRLHEGWAFDHWDISLDTGILPWHPEVLISSDAVVWPHYTQNVHVYFWKDRTKTERFPDTGMEKQPVGSLYQGAAPDADTVMAEAPVDDMRFRYWYDLNSGEIFDLATDKVLNALDLYPVFERAIYAFNDAATGTPLAVLYDGSPMNHEPEDRAGYYYAGLQVTCADGTTHVIPNGTPVTREYLTANNIPIPEKVNGRYNIPATPLYKQQRTVVYHTGDDAQFIIYGAEQQQEYTVTVDDELVLLGALDIINVTSPIGLALAGWTSDPDATGADDVMFIPNKSFEGDDALDTLVEAGGTVHLYPIWAPQENTIPINFVSQYPADAVDQNGNALQPRTYTVYIQKGARPTMPTLNKAGVQTPANQYADESRYVFAGWSRDADGKLSSTGDIYTQTYGTYTPAASTCST